MHDDVIVDGLGDDHDHKITNIVFFSFFFISQLLTNHAAHRA